MRPVLRLAGGLLTRWIYFRESHVWYRLDVTSQERDFQPPGGVKTSRATGIDSMITKVEIHYNPSRRAVEKAGFEKMGVMRLVRLAGHKRTTIQAMNQGPAQALAKRLRARVS